MMQMFRHRHPGGPNPRFRFALWLTSYVLFTIWFAIFYRFKNEGESPVPGDGPVLYLSNHQSFLDPVILGISTHKRAFFALARATLFKNPVFAFLIRSMNAIPVDRGTADMTAMRTCIDVMNQGHALLIFPEGTRTEDGKTGPFASGTMLLIKRARPVVVPVAIEGSFQAWPKGRKLPHLFGRISLRFGEPIPAEKLIEMGAEGALTHLQQVVEGMRVELARERDRR